MSLELADSRASAAVRVCPSYASEEGLGGHENRAERRGDAMASTILKQVLENVERGALIPLRSERRSASRVDPEAERLAQALHSVCASILAQVDRELASAMERLGSSITRRAVDTGPAEDAITGGLRDAPRTDEGLAIAAEPREAALDPVGLREELHGLRRCLESLPTHLESSAGGNENREILARLDTLSREVRDLGQRPAPTADTAPEPDDRRVVPAVPEQKRVQIGDIQGMIDSLLGNG